jgi:hypothetical protein
MIIRGAALANRFYASDGWTAELVAELLSDPDVRWVTTRYENEGVMPMLAHDEETNGPTYFAVYEHGIGVPPKPPPFLRSKISKHEYRPFKMGELQLECDMNFSDKNNVIEDANHEAGKSNDNRRRRPNRRRRS